jgi:hypothetical protein
MLAQQASGYDVGGRNFHIQEQPMHENFNFSCAGADQSAKTTDLVGSADCYSQPSRLPCGQPGHFAREAPKSA